MKRVCKCLQHVLKKDGGLVFHKATGHQLDCCVDADFAGLWGHEDDQDPVCVRSRTGFVMTLADCPVHWVSKLQTVQSLSTLESECVALAQAMREFVPMRRLLKEIVSNLDPNSEGVVSKMKSIVWEDNNGCIATVRAPKMSPRTKHIATRHHFTKQHINQPGAEILLEKTESSVQKADTLTKGLVEVDFQRLRKLLCGWQLAGQERASDEIKSSASHLSHLGPPICSHFHFAHFAFTVTLTTSTKINKTKQRLNFAHFKVHLSLTSIWSAKTK